MDSSHGTCQGKWWCLQRLFDESYYADLNGGILEGFGRLLRFNLRIYVYPTLDERTGKLVTASDLKVPPLPTSICNGMLIRESSWLSSLCTVPDVKQAVGSPTYGLVVLADCLRERKPVIWRSCQMTISAGYISTTRTMPFEIIAMTSWLEHALTQQRKRHQLVCLAVHVFAMQQARIHTEDVCCKSAWLFTSSSGTSKCKHMSAGGFQRAAAVRLHPVAGHHHPHQ